jgi:cell division transport system permease protein
MGPRWRYLFAELGIGLRRNLLMTVAMVVTVTVSLTLLGAGLLVQSQVNLARSLFFAQVEVSIFLQDGIPENQRASLENDLVGNALVEEVIYESKQDAYEHFQQIFADDPALLESVTPEVLPASFRVKLHDPEQFSVIRSQFETYPGVDTVRDQRDILDKFFRVMNKFQQGALAIAVLQGIGAAALISNTIRMTAFARREQTGIMKLVGATNWYIRLPFILEGVFAGVVGALMAGGLLLLGYNTLIDSLRREIFFIPFIGLDHVLTTIPLLVLIGAAVAAIASFLSLRRFLSV